MVLHPAAQPNSFPHLGSVTTLCATFAVAAKLRDTLGAVPRVLFWELENAPAQITTIGGAQYFRTLGDVDQGGRSRAETHLDSFRFLLRSLNALSGVSFATWSYESFQALPEVRRAILQILAEEATLAPLLCPSERHFKVRFRCPQCRLLAKAGGRLIATAPSGEGEGEGEGRVYENHCPEHGRYLGTLSVGGGEWFDTNTPVRALARELIYTDRRLATGSENLMCDGADWNHYAPMNMQALAHLGRPLPATPMRFFSPVILDWSGAKLAKSAQVGSDAYATTPQHYVNFEALRQQFGDGVVERLWDEARRWVDAPRRLFRNYTLQYMEAVLDTMTMPQPRTSA